MTIILQDSYTLPDGDQPLTHARIAHSRNWLSGGVATATATRAGYFADAPNNSLTYEKWGLTGGGAITYRGEAFTYRGERITYRAGDVRWTYDHGSAATVDYCVIGAHTLGTTQDPFQVQYSTDGVTWTAVIPLSTVTTDEPIMAIFAPVSARYWRVDFPTSGDLTTIAVIKFGEALQMQRATYAGNERANMARESVLRGNMSVTGEFLGQTVERTAINVAYSWQHLKSAWVDANWRDFLLATEREPFFIAWRPATYPDCLLGRRTSRSSPVAMGIKDMWEVSVDVMGRAYD